MHAQGQLMNGVVAAWQTEPPDQPRQPLLRALVIGGDSIFGVQRSGRPRI